VKKPTCIIALDLDGTLLDSQKNLSAANAAALARAAAAGAEVVPTTGRFFGGMPQAVRDLPFVRYAITVNGAQVYDRVADAALVREEMPLDTALEIMRLLDGYDVIYDCYQDNWGRMTKSMQDRAADYAPDVHYLKMIRELRKPYPDLKEHLLKEGRDVQKIMLFARDLAVRAAIADELKRRFPGVAVSSSTFNNLELNSAGAHKGAALARLAAALELTTDDCIAFGDGLNDLTMMQAAGTSVAMANSCPEVLAAADYTTLSNDEDGVAAFLSSRPLMRGKFITFEGGEGSGKSTQAKMLARALRDAGIAVLETREPGGTILAEQIRSLVREETADPPVARSETLLFLAARAQVVTEVILPALERGEWVVCDRFSDSTFAYQGYGRGLDVRQLRQMNDFATGGLKPDLTLLLDVPPDVSRMRVSARNASTAAGDDRIESAGGDFHARLREGFLELAAAEPERFVVIDGTADVETVRRSVLAAVRRFGANL